MLSKKTKYALQAMIGLAKAPQGKPVLTAYLAETEGIPKKFLELILLDLKSLGVVQSRQGKQGGYLLRRPLNKITLGEIVRGIEGPLALLPCVSQSAYERCAECPDEAACGLRLVMKDVRDATSKILDNTTLADVQERVAKARGGSDLMFHI
jgi:Rrf2 family protein